MSAYNNEMFTRRQKLLERQANEQPKQEEANSMPRVNFSLVAGTELLNEQLKLIKPQIHIFG